MSRTNTRGSNPSFGTPVPRVGQRGGTQFSTVSLPSKRACNPSAIAYARRFNKGVIE